MYDDLIRQYAPLVRRIAQRYSYMHEMDPSIDLDDLVQYGYMGLIEAAETYQDDKDASFFTWAFWCIRRSIQSGVRPSAKKAHRDTISLDAPVSASEPEDGSMIDNLQDLSLKDLGDLAADDDLHHAVMAALDDLPTSEKDAIRWKYLSGLPAGEALRTSGMTQAEYSSNIRKGIRKLQNYRYRLQHYIDENTRYFQHVGVETFIRTRTSSVESAVLWRAEQAH